MRRYWPSTGSFTRTAALRPAQTSRQAGFSMLELLFTLVIIGILVLFASPYYVYVREKAKVARCSEEIRGLEREISAYALEKGSLPSSLADIRRGSMRDPWGHPYRYSTAADAGADRRTFLGLGDPLCDDFDLYSVGSNGVSTPAINTAASEDDVVRTRNDDAGAFIGAVYQLNDF